ncbi:MAG TPA: hypothetical protein VGJ79_11170 [Candidatus Dormibacteraeota bacterium]|jgi:hypothetical protein
MLLGPANGTWSAIFCLIKRCIGAPQQTDDIVVSLQLNQPDREANACNSQLAANLLKFGSGSLGGRVRQDADEFVSPIPDDQVLAAKAPRETRRQTAEQFVAGGMAAGVVCQFEAINIKEGNAQGALLAPGPGDFTFSGCDSRGPSKYARQVVERGLLPELEQAFRRQRT